MSRSEENERTILAILAKCNLKAKKVAAQGAQFEATLFIELNKDENAEIDVIWTQGSGTFFVLGLRLNTDPKKLKALRLALMPVIAFDESKDDKIIRFVID